MKVLIQTGVTLIELMVVIVVLGIIAGIALPAYTGYVETSRQGECMNEVAAIRLAEEEFFLNQNSYFPGATAAALGAASGNIYTPSTTFAAGTANCGVAVTLNGAGTQYTITATGTGKLPTSYSYVITGP